MKRCVAGAIALTCLSLWPTNVQAQPAYQTVLHTKHLIYDAAMRADTTALRFGIERLKPLTDDPDVGAFANYHISFAYWQLLFTTWSRIDDSRGVAEAAVAYSQKAVDQDSTFWDAYGLAILTKYLLARVAPEHARTLYPAANALLARGLAAVPDNPYLLLPDASRRFFLPILGGPLASLQHYEKVFAAFEHREPASLLHPDWGAEMAHAMLATAYIYMPNVAHPQILQAREHIQHALALRPDFDFVCNSLLPMTDPVLTYLPEAPAITDWTRITNDARDDHSNKALADGRGLSYAHDTEADSVWFKFDFFSLPDTNVVGLNLVLDTDNDQATGMAWWGNNTDFMYDKLVTVWVVNPGDGIYRGTVGTGHAEDTFIGRFTSIKRHNISLHIDGNTSTVIIGLPRADLDEDGSLTILGAVGSSTLWNDDLSAPQMLQLNTPE